MSPHELVMQSTCGAYELFFWVAEPAGGPTQPPGAVVFRPEPSASKLRDACWVTWTSTLGWPVQGIWSKVGRVEAMSAFQVITLGWRRGGEGEGGGRLM